MRSLLLTVALAAQLLAACDTGRPGRTVGRPLTDPTGRSVIVPERVERIGCLTGASYEKAFLLGAGERIVVRAATSPPWMRQTNPQVDRIAVVRNSHAPNVEELLQQHLDLLFFWDDAAQLTKLRSNGITVVSPQITRSGFASAAEFTSAFANEVHFYGEALGGNARQRATAWIDYFAERLAKVQARTTGLPAGQRPRVYYVRGPDALTTHGGEQNFSWLGELAGADMVVRRSDARGIAQVGMEQILLWNPEVIFVGRQYSTDLILKDPRWRNVAAVRAGRVYALPDGVFYWDSSSEGVLLLLYLAQILHPGLFPDIDLRREVHDYYARFYAYELSPRELDLLLAGLGPDGHRQNAMNN